MGYRTCLAATIFPLFFISQPCNAQRYTKQGAVVGGATGAAIGGLLGKQTGKTTGGAIIGGAVGAIAGGVMGNSHDQAMARQRYSYENAMYVQQQQFYAQQQAQVAQQAQSGVTPADVMSMSRSGVNESVIIAQLHTRGIQRRLEVSDIISLHQQGVSESLISAMQAAPLSSQLNPRVPQEQRFQHVPPPVIVREPRVIYAPPPVIYEHYHAYPVYSRGVTIRSGF